MQLQKVTISDKKEHGEPFTIANFIIVMIMMVTMMMIIYLFFFKEPKLLCHLPFQATQLTDYHLCPFPTSPTYLPAFIWAITWKLVFTKECSVFCLEVLKLHYCN